MTKEKTISIVTLVNRPDIYQENVVTSTLDLQDIIEYIVIPSPPSASKGLNMGLEKASNDLVICCHQDIYFIKGWYDHLVQCLSMLDQNWGVCGIAGTPTGGPSVGVCSGLGMNGNTIIPVQTLDCSFLILRKSKGLKFDENLEYFHMYGEDIALQANEKGLGVCVINVPIDHRTKWTSGQGFGESCEYLKKKWWNRFRPIYTTVGVH